MKTNFKNNLKNLSICNDGFSVNLVGFQYKKQGSKSKEGFSCKNHKKPKLAFGRRPQQRAMTWPHYGSRLFLLINLYHRDLLTIMLQGCCPNLNLYHAGPLQYNPMGSRFIIKSFKINHMIIEQALKNLIFNATALLLLRCKNWEVLWLTLSYLE